MSCVTRRPTKPYLAMTATGSNATDGTGRLSSRTPCSPAGSGLSPSARWLVAVVALAALAGAASAETWGGLTVAPEHRFSPYDRKRDTTTPSPSNRTSCASSGPFSGPTRRPASTRPVTRTSNTWWRPARRTLPGKTRARGAQEPARPVGDDILLARRDRAPGRLDDWGLLICRHSDARGVS